MILESRKEIIESEKARIALLKWKLVIVIVGVSCAFAFATQAVTSGQYASLKNFAAVGDEPESKAEDQARVEDLLSECNAYLQMHALTTPTAGSKGRTALVCYQEVLQLHPDSEAAHAGLEKIAARYVRWIMESLKREQVTRARVLMQRLEQVDPNHPQLSVLADRVGEIERSMATAKRRAHAQRPKRPKRSPSAKPYAKRPFGPPTGPVPPEREPEQQPAAGTF